jgi:hypothetical protein
MSDYQYDPTDPNPGYMYTGEPPAPECVSVTALDQNDFPNVPHWTLPGQVVTDFNDPSTMVDAVNAAANGAPLCDLTVEDHGSPGRQQMGKGVLTAEALQDPEMLAKIQELQFAPGAKIELGGCSTGYGEEGEALLRQMAIATGVPVSAGITTQYDFPPGIEGSEVTCYPVSTADGPDAECVTDSSIFDGIY